MRLKSPWKPRLSGEAQLPCDRLAAALAEDILDGKLAAGERLPPHRDLAWHLGIGLGSVTKAYGILERRGLVYAVKGSGTFVAATGGRKGVVIDLSQNAPPAVMSERLLARTLTALARQTEPALFNSYPPVPGHVRFRTGLARWFGRLGTETGPGRLLLTGGAQHALTVCLSMLCGPGSLLLVEAQTYPCLLTLARYSGVRLAAVAMDHEGMEPEALDRALQAAGPDVRASVYLMPTMQNPVATCMSRARREDILAVCRRHGALIIEDDVYALGADPALPSLTSLDPERVFYINSLSKTLNPSLRIGGLVVPAAWQERAEACLYAHGLMISPLSCLVMEHWIMDGTAQTICDAIGEEAARRRALAASILGDALPPHPNLGYHVWLPMADQEAQALAAAARALGILVTDPLATAAAPQNGAAGVRLCIGAPAQAELESALKAIAGLLANLRGAIAGPLAFQA